LTEAGSDVWVGLDVGSQSARAVAVTASGVVVGSGKQPLVSERTGDRHEQNPNDWWRAVAAASLEAMQTVSPACVRGVAVDGTSGTIVLVDGEGSALTPGLMYDDIRAAGFVDRVNEAGERVWADLGYSRMQPSWALPRLLWLLEAYPHLPLGARLAYQTDFVNRRLVGHEVPTDLSNALKGGAHLIEERWPREVMDSLNVPSSLLPGLVRSGTVIGTVNGPAAATTGLPMGTPVVAGMTDGCAAQLGAGALRRGSWNSVLGTTLVLKGVSDELVRDPLGVLYSHRSPSGGWLPGGASSCGAGFVSRDFGGRDLDELSRAAGDREPAEALTYPLVSTGERFPFVAPAAHGFSIGGNGSDADRFAAALQGVGYMERLCYDYVGLLGLSVDGVVTLTGGAASNRYWCQLRADILGRPVAIPDNSEPALGMAVLAASVERNLADVAAEMVRIETTIDPRPQSVERFLGPYIRLVDELESRGWLGGALAGHARKRVEA
jgi:D-ribulokinase